MRKVLGVGVLLSGVAGLGWWGSTHEAPRMEARIRAAAEPLSETSLHGVWAHVHGRDIELSGLADSEAEREALLRAYEAVPGRRVVRDRLEVLPLAKPYTTTISRAEPDAPLTASGLVPSEFARESLATLMGAKAVEGLGLASGASMEHLGLVEVGIAALRHMVRGQAEVTDGLLRVSGDVADPTQKAAVEAELAKVPPELTAATLTLLDDGAPVAWQLDVSALGGAVLSGKLPYGFDLNTLQSAIGLDQIANEARTAPKGATPDAAYALPDLFGRLTRWLPELETLRVEIPATGQAQVAAGIGKGADAELIRTGLAADLPDVALTVTEVAPNQAEGTERTNPLTRQTERLTAGFWIPVATFTADKATCQAEADALLASSTVNFLSGSDRLDATGLRVLNRLAAVIAPCAKSGLKAEIGGHTDATGDPLANIGLSQRRADAVLGALIARGVDRQMLRAQGYGAAQPIADNATENGRAMNRRTTVTWSE